MPVFDHLHQILSLLCRDLLHTPVAQDQQVGFQQLVHQPGVAAIAVGDAHLLEQARYPQVANRESLPAGLVTEGACQPGLAATGWAGDAQVQGLADPVTAGEARHTGALQPSRVVVVDVFNTGRHTQTGGLEQPLQSPVFAVQHLPVDEYGQAFLERQVVG